jgi:hypothetical protein
MREVKPQRHRHRDRGKNTGRLAGERGDRHRPRTGAESADDGAGVDERETEQDELHRISPRAGEPAEAVIGVGANIGGAPPAAPPLREKRHDRHEGKGGVEPAQEDAPPRQCAADQNVGPHLDDATMPESHRRGDRTGDEQGSGRLMIGGRIAQFHDDQAEDVAGDPEQQEERDGGMAAADVSHDEISERQIGGARNRPATDQH